MTMLGVNPLKVQLWVGQLLVSGGGGIDTGEVFKGGGVGVCECPLVCIGTELLMLKAISAVVSGVNGVRGVIGVWTFSGKL